MVSKNLPNQYQNCNTNPILIIRNDIKLPISKLLFGLIPYGSQNDTRAIYLGMKVLEWYIDSNGIRNRNALTYTYPTAIQKHLTYLPSAQCRYFDMHLGRSKQDAQPAKRK